MRVTSNQTSPKSKKYGTRIIQLWNYGDFKKFIHSRLDIGFKGYRSYELKDVLLN